MVAERPHKISMHPSVKAYKRFTIEADKLLQLQTSQNGEPERGILMIAHYKSKQGHSLAWLY